MTANELEGCIVDDGGHGYIDQMKWLFDQHEDAYKRIQKFPVPIMIQKTRDDAIGLTRLRDTDLGFDVHVVDDKRWSTDKVKNKYFVLNPGCGYTFKTGIKVATPPHYGFILRDRSSYGVKNIALLAGVIEGTYRGEWGVHLLNMGSVPHTINPGDRIAQAILTFILPTVVEFRSSLPESERGDKGWGSSGK